MKLTLKRPLPPERKFSESDNHERLNNAIDRIDTAIAKMQSLEWDVDGKLCEIKCGVKPTNGSAGKPEFKPEAKPA
jgi:hypothetical protein